MGNIIKSVVFWVLRFFDCLLSKRYWQKKIFPQISKSLYEFAVYIVESMAWIFFIIVTVATVIVCLVPGLILFVGDKLFSSSPLKKNSRIFLEST